jgi:hypothetical protein
MKKKIVLFLSFVFAINTFVFSQSTFIYSEKDSLKDDFFLDAVELQNENLILVGGEQKIENGTIVTQDILVLNLDSKGNVKMRKVINPEGFPSTANNIVQINPNSFLLTGNIYNDSSQLLFVKLDSTLNITGSKVIPIPGYQVGVTKIKIDHNENLIIYGNVTLGSTGWPNHPFIYKFSKDLDSLGLKILDYLSFGSVDVLEKTDNKGYYLITSGDASLPGNGHIFNMDTTFGIIRIDSVPHQVSNFCNTKWISDSKFILTGSKDNGPPLTDNIGALVLDTSYSVSYGNRYGIVDTSSIPGVRKNLGFYASNEIFIGGIYFYGVYDFFAPINSWFYLNHVDTTLEIIWQKYYGGDKNYCIFGMIATKDSGCLMYGATYDWQKEDYQRDVYAIKVNKQGMLLSTGTPLQGIAKDAIVYPNPGTDHLVIQSGPQVSGAEFRMLSINGMQVVSKKLTGRKVIVNTQDFSSGTYVWQIVLNDRVIETGKWIKD